MMKILAIETSCDETAAAVVEDGTKVLSNIIASQADLHAITGGVVPEVAAREHIKALPFVYKQALIDANCDWSDIDAIAATETPGLISSLLIGIQTARMLATIHKKQYIPVNHIDGHIYSNWLGRNKADFKFPLITLTVSGGHNSLFLLKSPTEKIELGHTQDDAAGEAFDKVAKMLELGYPGGPIIAALAKRGEPVYDLPVPMQHSDDLNFSFSGLKTACLYKIQKLKLTTQVIEDFCASFEKAAVTALTAKLAKAIEKYQPQQIVLGGGVINNLKLRQEARRTARQFGVKVFTPYSQKLFSDNAAMIGVTAWHQAQRGDFVKEVDSLTRQPNLNF